MYTCTDTKIRRVIYIKIMEEDKWKKINKLLNLARSLTGKTLVPASSNPFSHK